jgi:cyclic-di-GMP phosphodiesterase TipF (flagellum assembly factor)
MRAPDAKQSRAVSRHGNHNNLAARVPLHHLLDHRPHFATTLADHDTTLATLQSRASPAAAAENHPVAAPPVVVDPEAARQERLRVLAAEGGVS